MMKKLFIYLVFLLPFVANATVLEVTSNSDDGEGTLRQLIDDATDGDTISIPEGMHIVLEAGIYVGKDLTIISSIDNKAIIDANQKGSCFAAGNSTPFTIKGLILKNGVNSQNGGAISIYKGSFYAFDCVFENNKVENTDDNSSHSGGAIYFHATRGGDKLMIKNCVFRNNMVRANETVEGGALYVWNIERLVVENTIFENNIAESLSATDFIYGGAIYTSNVKTYTLFDKVLVRDNQLVGGYAPSGGGAYFDLNTFSSSNDTLIIQNSTFSGNIVTSSLEGTTGMDAAGFYVSAGDRSVLIKLENSTVASNAIKSPASGAGAGIVYGGTSLPDIAPNFLVINSTIANNTIEAVGNKDFVRGGGVFNGYGKNMKVINSILYNNTVSVEGQDMINEDYYQYSLDKGEIFVGQNIVGVGRTESGYSTIELLGDSVSTEDPLLGTLSDNGGGVYTIPLGEESPAIDKGVLSYPDIDLVFFDQRGVSRRKIDLGAYEFGDLKENQFISFTTLSDTWQVGDRVVPELSASSSLEVVLSSSNTDVAIINNGEIEFVGDGVVTITATQDGNEFFEVAEPVSQELTVSIVSSEEDLLSLDFIYPNPVKSNLYFSFKVNAYQVFDLKGELIKSGSESDVIDVADLEMGVYVIKITRGDDELLTKFIKE